MYDRIKYGLGKDKCTVTKIIQYEVRIGISRCSGN